MRPALLLPLLAALLAAAAPAPARAAPPATVTGELQEVHGHRLDGTEVDVSWRIETATGGTIALGQRQDPELVGQQVTLTDGDPQARGIQGRARLATFERVAAAEASGPRSVLVLVITTPDKAAPATPAAARQAVFSAAASANAFYREQSDGATSLAGRVDPSGDVAEVSIGQRMAGCDYYAIAAAARSAADAAGWNTAAYDHRVYLHPSSSTCDYGGLGTVPGSDSWSNGSLRWDLIAHELGHNMGAHHANALDCTERGAPVPLSATCTSVEYADPFDVMGGDGMMGAWHREQIGQLAAAETVSLRAAASLTLTAVDGALSGLQHILVPIKAPGVPVEQWYSLDLRAPSAGPFNPFAAGSPATTGVTIRIVPRLDVHTQSQLIDMGANSRRSHADAPLQPGATFSDPAHGISIAARATGSGTVGVDVTMPALVDDVPPSAVGSLSAGGDTNRVDLSWGAASDDEGLARYDVTRDGVPLGSTAGLSLTDTDAAALGTVTYAVVAVDTSGNAGPVTARQLTLPDATPPSAIARLTAVASPSGIALSWPAASDNRGVAGYRVVRDGTTVGTPAVTSFSEQPAAGPHTYAVQAVDAAGNLGPATSVQSTMPSPSSTQTAPVTTTATAPGTPAGPETATPAAQRSPGTNRTAARAAFKLSTKRTRRLSGGRRRITVTFTCPGASSMRAFLGGRRIARSTTSRVKATFTMSRRQKRATVLVKAQFRDGTAQRSWVFR